MSLVRHRALAASVGFAACCSLLAFAAFGPAPAEAAPPSNDNFADAQVVGPAVPIAIAGTTVDATAEAGEPPAFSTNPPQNTVWFSWTAPSSMTAVIDVCDNDTGFTSPAIGVFTGNALNALTPVASTAGDCLLRFSAASGQNYKIVVDSYFSQGSFTFRIRPLTPPANDDFANAETIGPSLPITISRSNLDSTTETNEPSVNGGGGGRSVWFKWTAPASQSVRLDMCDFQTRSGAANEAVGVYTGNTLTTLVKVFENAFQCRTTFNAVSGTTYRIAFSGNFGGEGTFTLRILPATPPANDDFAAAIPVGPGLPVSLGGDNRFATVQAMEPDHGAVDDTTFSPHDSVWYTWTPSANVQARIRVCNSDFGARLGVYSGNAVNALTRVMPAVPINQQPFCSLRFNAVMGTTYRIAVGGSQEDTEGNFNLDIHVFTPPANDNFADAQQLRAALPVSMSGSTIDAGAETGEPSHDGDLGPEASVWYRWTPSSGGPVSIDTCASDFDALIGVHTGSALNALTRVSTSDGGPGCGGPFGGKLTMDVTAGTTYFIAVDGFHEGNFTLALRSLNPPPAPTTPGFNLAAALKKCHKLKSRAKRQRCVKKAKKRATLEAQTG
jgi:hypothetical protein